MSQRSKLLLMLARQEGTGEWVPIASAGTELDSLNEQEGSRNVRHIGLEENRTMFTEDDALESAKINLNSANFPHMVEESRSSIDIQFDYITKETECTNCENVMKPDKQPNGNNGHPAEASESELSNQQCNVELWLARHHGTDECIRIASGGTELDSLNEHGNSHNVRPPGLAENRDTSAAKNAFESGEINLNSVAVTHIPHGKTISDNVIEHITTR
nr:unnamed protein product [Callosobruchus analis]